MEISKKELLAMDKRTRITLVNSLPGYKCLQLVATLTPAGTSNLAIINSVFHVGADPALLGFVLRPKSDEHDTLSNLVANGKYTFNNVLPEWYEKAHQTSARYASGFSEFVECGFTEYFFSDFAVPFVAESTIKVAMELREVIPVKINGTTIVIGEIMQLIANEKIIGTDGYVDHDRAGTVSVVGLDSYFTGLPLTRLAYAKPEMPPRPLNRAHNFLDSQNGN
jgi:flavin reductase (DIM6/NTAB) family NADH-FMN oxidoreductase RutF